MPDVYRFRSPEDVVVGEDWPFTFNLGADITGATIEMQGRATVDAAATVFDSSTTNGEIVISDASAGVFVVTVPPATTGSASAGTIHYDIKVTYASGAIEVPLVGTIDVRAAVTR